MLKHSVHCKTKEVAKFAHEVQGEEIHTLTCLECGAFEVETNTWECYDCEQTQEAKANNTQVVAIKAKTFGVFEAETLNVAEVGDPVDVCDACWIKTNGLGNEVWTPNLIV